MFCQLINVELRDKLSSTDRFVTLCDLAFLFEEFHIPAKMCVYNSAGMPAYTEAMLYYSWQGCLSPGAGLST